MSYLKNTLQVRLVCSSNVYSFSILWGCLLRALLKTVTGGQRHRKEQDVVPSTVSWRNFYLWGQTSMNNSVLSLSSLVSHLINQTKSKGKALNKVVTALCQYLENCLLILFTANTIHTMCYLQYSW